MENISQANSIITADGWIDTRGRKPDGWLIRCLIWHPQDNRAVFAVWRKGDFSSGDFYEEASLAKVIHGVIWWQPEPKAPPDY